MSLIKSYRELDEHYDKVMGQIVRMMDQSEKWLIRSSPLNKGAGESESRRTGAL